MTCECLVSIVIPAYNRANFLIRSVESVLACDEISLEVIVVDDGSTDDTQNKLAFFANRDTKIVLCRHEQKRGAQAARNTGIMASSGKFVGFLDSDDEYLPGSISKRLAAMAKCNAPVSHSECLVLRYPETFPQPFGTPPLQGDVLANLLRSPGPTYPALLVRKDVMESIGLLDESIVAYQEWDLAIRLAAKHRFAFSSEPTFIYNCHAGETISKDVNRATRGYVQIVEKHEDLIRKVHGARGVAKHALKISRMFESNGEAENSKKYLAIANRESPAFTSTSEAFRRLRRAVKEFTNKLASRFTKLRNRRNLSQV